MIHAAVFGAEEVITSGLGRFEPFSRVPPGHDVGLDPKSGYEHVVNHILCGHDQFDLASDRHVQLVDLALAGAVLKLPHPLFSDHINFECVCRWAILPIEKAGAPKEEAHRNQQRNYRPECFQPVRAFDRPRNLEGVAPAIAYDKENNGAANQQRKKYSDAAEIKI